MPNFICLGHCVQDKMHVSQTFMDTPRTCKKYQTIASRVASLTNHNISEISRKFHFLRLFLNKDFVASEKKTKLSSFCFAEFVDY